MASVFTMMRLMSGNSV